MRFLQAFPQGYNESIHKNNMSDGNFNRALLPKNELSAGIRAGKAQMRTKANEALEEVLKSYFPELPTEKKTEIKQKFAELLR